MLKMISNKTGTSPYSRKGLIVLEEKGLPYEQVNVDPEYLPDDFGETMNPNLRVSVLVDGDRNIFESDNIVDYLLRTYPDAMSPSAPTPPLAATVTRPDHHIDDAMILVTIETVLNSSVNIGLFAFSDTNPADIKPWGWPWERDPTRIHSCLKWLDARATSEGFVPGVFSVMDINLICALRLVNTMTSEDWSIYKNLSALNSFFADRPSVVKSLQSATQ